MKCNECRALLPVLALGELPDEQRGDVEDHLKICASCQAEMEQIQGICRGLEEDAQGDSLSEVERLRIESAVYKRLAASESAYRLRHNRLLTVLTRVAAAIILFALGFTVHSFITDHTQPETIRHVQQANPSLTEYEYGVSSSMRFSAAGLKVIAQGRKAALAEWKNKASSNATR
jgi:anti-sigma factor RsiW